MKAVCAVLAVGILAGVADADIRSFSNSSGQFVWEESFFVSEFEHGNSLDLTQPASQTGDPSPTAFMSFSETFFASEQVVTTSVEADFPGSAAIARGPAEFIDHEPYSRDVFPAVSFGLGDLIGASIADGTWERSADINFRAGMGGESLIGGRAYIGLRITLPDGVHYGWIDIIDHGYNTTPSFEAFGWAWETTPDMPIPAGVVPSPRAAVVLLVLAAGRRRRE